MGGKQPPFPLLFISLGGDSSSQALIQTRIYPQQVCSILVTCFTAITLIVWAQQLYFPLQFKPNSTDQKSMRSINDPQGAGSVQSQSAT